MAKHFRETLWFKRGELAADVPADAEVPAELPIEDRYIDDPSVTTTDSIQYGVRTGSTAYMRPFVLEPEPDMALPSLVGEMKSQPGVLALIGGTMAMAVAVIALYAF